MKTPLEEYLVKTYQRWVEKRVVKSDVETTSIESLLKAYVTGTYSTARGNQMHKLEGA